MPFSFHYYDVFDVLGSLMYLNEATLLNNMRVRYKNDIIYVGILVKLFQIRVLVFLL